VLQDINLEIPAGSTLASTKGWTLLAKE